MIGEMDADTVLTNCLQDPAQHPHTVKKQRGIRRQMDIALHHRAVHACLPALFDIFLSAMSHQNPVDLLPGGWRYPLDVLRNGRFLETLIRNADAAEGPQRDGVRHVKRQQLVTGAKHLLDDGRTQHLLGTHPIGAGIMQLAALAKVLMNPIGYGRFLIENPADALQFHGLGMIGSEVHKRQLFFALFAHFVVVPFFILIAISIAWTLSLYYQKKRKSTAKCAFFMQFN